MFKKTIVVCTELELYDWHEDLVQVYAEYKIERDGITIGNMRVYSNGQFLSPKLTKRDHAKLEQIFLESLKS